VSGLSMFTSLVVVKQHMQKIAQHLSDLSTLTPNQRILQAEIEEMLDTVSEEIGEMESEEMQEIFDGCE